MTIIEKLAEVHFENKYSKEIKEYQIKALEYLNERIENENKYILQQASRSVTVDSKNLSSLLKYKNLIENKPLSIINDIQSLYEFRLIKLADLSINLEQDLIKKEKTSSNVDLVTSPNKQEITATSSEDEYQPIYELKIGVKGVTVKIKNSYDLRVLPYVKVDKFIVDYDIRNSYDTKRDSIITLVGEYTKTYKSYIHTIKLQNISITQLTDLVAQLVQLYSPDEVVIDETGYGKYVKREFDKFLAERGLSLQ